MFACFPPTREVIHKSLMQTNERDMIERCSRQGEWLARGRAPTIIVATQTKLFATRPTLAYQVRGDCLVPVSPRYYFVHLGNVLLLHNYLWVV